MCVVNERGEGVMKEVIRGGASPLASIAASATVSDVKKCPPFHCTAV